MSDFDTVKQRADLVDVVGQYTALQRAGRNFKACCPFHNEKTPSFYVYPEGQSWHCFGACATGGDVFTFIEKKESVTPMEALRLLADRYGVPLERSRRREDEPAGARLIEANEAAAQYFHNLLLNAAAGEPARAYLAKRGLDADTVRAFQLGFSTETWDGLCEHLKARGFSVQEQTAAGLLSEGERGAYDRFRNRLMFPIRDERGRVTGFGGRVLGDGVPKYLNTPQTALFDKGGTLYALDRAKEAIRTAGAAVVVEGYMDVIAAHQHGIANVVATLGTALTERHLSLLRRHARQVVLAMDADAAGIEAALRGEELVRKASGGDGDAGQVVVDWRSLVRVQAAAPVEVRVFTVPQGKDPDEAIRADPAAFRALAERAVPPFEFRLRHDLAAIDRNSPRERLALADRLLPLVAGVADRAVQAQYLARLAQATAIPEEVLAARMHSGGGGGGARTIEALPLRERVQRGRRGERPAGSGPRPTPDTGGDASPAGDTPAAPASAASHRDELPDCGARQGAPPSTGVGGTGAPRTESVCLRLLLTYPSLRPAGMSLEEGVFTEPAYRALFHAWRRAGTEAVHDSLDDAGRELLTRVLAERIPPYEEATAARALEDVVARLRLRLMEDRGRLMAAAIRDAEAADGPQTAARALAALAGHAPAGDGAEAEVAQHLLADMELAHDRHALEAGLRMHTGRSQNRDDAAP